MYKTWKIRVPHSQPKHNLKTGQYFSSNCVPAQGHERSKPLKDNSFENTINKHKTENVKKKTTRTKLTPHTQ